MTKNKPNQGVKKTETLTLRLEPKLKFLIELISRMKRQSITGVVESAVEDLAFGLDVSFHDNGTTEPLAMVNALANIWSTDESERFLNFCYHLPHLMTYEDQRVWETIKVSPVFFEAKKSKASTPRKIESLDQLDRLVVSQSWQSLLQHVEMNKDNRVVVPFERRH